MKDLRKLILQKLHEWTGAKSTQIAAKSLENRINLQNASKREIKKLKSIPEFETKIYWNCNELDEKLDYNQIDQPVNHFNANDKRFFKQVSS